MEVGSNLFGGIAPCGWGGNGDQIEIGGGLFGAAGGSSGEPEIVIGTGGGQAAAPPIQLLGCSSLLDVIG